MTTLPAPPGYVNKGKGRARHLTDDEEKLVANYVRYHSQASASVYFGVSESVILRIQRKNRLAPRRPGNYTAKEIEDMQHNPYEMLRAVAKRLSHSGHATSYLFPGVLRYEVRGALYGFHFTVEGGSFTFRLFSRTLEKIDVAPVITLPINPDRRRLEKWVLKVVKDYAHYTPKKRFVLAVGSYREEFPDIPPGLDGPHCTCMWDRQEGKVVVQVNAPYDKLICLERGDTKPFTALEEWINNLSNTALESEGLPTTRRAGKQR